MTLIAAFQIQNVPILLGDFLITGGSHTGIRKKVHRISPNLVIGWTGHMYAATPVLKEIYEALGNRYVSRSELEKLLKNYPMSDLGNLEVRLIGWIIDSEPRCFLWNSAYPHEIFYEPYHFDGSGAEAFQQLLEIPSQLFSSNVERTIVENAVMYTLIKSCRLVSDEVLDKFNRKMGFGFAYEILYFDGSEFKYVDNILYLAWDFFYDVSKNEGLHRLHPITFKYRSFTYYSVVQINHLDDKRGDFYAITPVFDRMPDLFDKIKIPGIDTENRSFSLESDYYCLFYRFEASDGIRSTGSVVYQGGHPENSLYVVNENGKEFIELRFDLVPNLYGMLKEYRRMKDLRTQ